MSRMPEEFQNPVRAPVHPWEQPGAPWKRLHIDFAGPFCGAMWLIVVDAETKWPEVVQMESTTASKTVQNLRSLFSKFGIPHQLVSDNGPQFVSEEFKQFCEQNGIRRTLVAPYHPRSNGEAERFVQTFKSAMRKADKTKLSIALSQFLLRYRTTPHPTTGKTPAELIFGRRIRTRLDLIHPTQTTKSQKEKSPRSENSRELKVGDAVWMRNYTGTDKWISGMVISKSGPLSYVIQARNQTHRRHIDQLKKREGKSDTPNDFDEFMELPTSSTTPNETVPNAAESRGQETVTDQPRPAIQADTSRQYPVRRNRKPPEYFGH